MPISTVFSVIYSFSRLDTEAVVRCSPAEDATNGFFVSCFVRHRSRSTRSDVGQAEVACARGNNTPGPQSIKASAKRKVHPAGDKDSASVQPTSNGRRKRRK
jgi:hypothetical protein